MDYFHYQPHPITDRDFWEGVKRDDRFTGLLAAIQTAADTAEARPPMPLASDYMAAKWHNDRNRVDLHWQNDRRMLSYLIVNRCLKGIDPDDRDERLLDWLWSFTNEATWTVSAHVPGGGIPDMATPILDLASTEMGALLAEAVEVLQPWMDTISPKLATSILQEVDRRVLHAFSSNQFQQFTWAKPDNPHVSNWTGVCAGSVLAACRALANLGQPRPEAEKKSLDLLRMFWDRGFTRSGECDEGIGYWIYGVSFACYGMSRLSADEYRASFDTRRVAQVAGYPRRAHLTGNLFFNGNDSGMSYGQPTYLTPWLAAATGEEWLLQWPAGANLRSMQEQTSERQRIVQAGQQHFRHLGILLRALNNPRTQAGPAEVATDAPPSLLEDQQAAIVRTDTAAGPMIVCLSGGSNAERHNHNDVGQFLVFLSGEQRVVDLGSPHYLADFFGPKRYTYMAARSMGHNVPVINGQEQIAGETTAGKVLEWSPRSGEAVLALDLAAAYPAEAKLKSWTRTLRQRNDPRVPFALEDQYVTTEPGIAIAHAWWTVDRPEFLAADRVRMGRLVFHLTRPATVRSEEVLAASIHLRDFVGQTLYRVELAYETDGHGNLSVQTLIAVE